MDLSIINCLISIAATLLINSCNADPPSLINARYVREHDLNTYVNYITNHFEVKKTYAQTQIAKGRHYLYEGKFDLAERHLKNVLEKYPKHEEALELLTRIDDYARIIDAAKTFEEFVDIPKAIEIANYAIEIAPSSKAAYEYRAKLQGFRGQYAAASDNILTRVSTILQGNNTEEYYRLAHLLYEREYGQEAVRIIEKCLDLEPKNKDCLSSYEKINKFFKHLSKGEKASEERRYKDCITEAEELVKNQETWNFKAKNLLCRCYLKDHRTEEAIYACSQVLSFRHDLDAYCNRAEALLESSLSSVQAIKINTALALQDYARVLEIDPHFDRAIYGQSRAQTWSYVQRFIIIPFNLWEMLPIPKFWK